MSSVSASNKREQSGIVQDDVVLRTHSQGKTVSLTGFTLLPLTSHILYCSSCL